MSDPDKTPPVRFLVLKLFSLLSCLCFKWTLRKKWVITTQNQFIVVAMVNNIDNHGCGNEKNSKNISNRITTNYVSIRYQVTFN